MKDTIDTMIESERPTLSQEEQNALFVAIEASVAKPIPSPYFDFIRSRAMTTALIALMVALGTSGTVLASDGAKPGDFLFPIDRVTEQARLIIAADDHKEKLRKKYAEERLNELRVIIKEESNSNGTSDDSSTEVTIDSEVKIAAAVEILLDYIESIESGESKSALFNELLLELDAIKVSDRTNGNTNIGTDDTRLRIQDDRVELREDGYRVRIDDDGEVRIKRDDDIKEGDHYAEDDSVDDDWSEDGQNEGDRRGDGSLEDDNDGHREDFEDDESKDEDDSSGDEDDAESLSGDVSISEFEVKIKEEETEVHIKYDGKEIEYKTSADTVEEIVSEAANKTGLSEADLEMTMDIEIDD